MGLAQSPYAGERLEQVVLLLRGQTGATTTVSPADTDVVARRPLTTAATPTPLRTCPNVASWRPEAS
jgi:hypothetical protein